MITGKVMQDWHRIVPTVEIVNGMDRDCQDQGWAENPSTHPFLRRPLLIKVDRLPLARKMERKYARAPARTCYRAAGWQEGNKMPSLAFAIPMEGLPEQMAFFALISAYAAIVCG